MKRRIDFFQVWLRVLYEWLFTVLCSYFIMIIFLKSKPEKYMEATLLIVYILSYIIRRNSRYNFVVFISHLLISGGVFLLPFSNKTKWVIVCIVIYLMNEAFVYWRKGKNTNFKDVPWPTFLMSLIIYTYAYFSKSDFLVTSAYIIPIILVVLYLLIIYTDGLRLYVDSNKNTSGLPMGKIVSINSAIIFLVIMILLSGIVIGSVLGIDVTLYKALKGLVYAISYAFIFLKFIFTVLTAPLSGKSNASLEGEKNKIKEFASEHTDDFSGILDMIFKIGAMIIIIYLIYKVASFVIKLLMKKRLVEGDRVEKIVNKNKETRAEKNRKKSSNLFSKEQKFRKLYRERVLRNRYDIRLDNTRTCIDIRDELFDKEIDDIKEITEAYRKVRYGEEKVTKDMLKLFDE